MKNIPKRIYLQIGDLTDKDDKNIDFNELSDVCWSSEKIFSTDIEFIRKPDIARKSVENIAKEANGRSRACKKCRYLRKGAKWADEHPNRWISVEDRLPEQNKKVIVICEKLDTAPFYKISLGHIVDKSICKDNYNGWDIPNVVYWTPMPKLPEEI